MSEPEGAIDRLAKCKVSVNGMLVDAMSALTEGAVGVALVLSEKATLVGTLTDGDIRRALLNGATLQSPLEPFVHRQFTSVPESASRAEVLELMQARYLSQIPIVDTQGNVIGLHLLRELLGGAVRSNWAVIMAGGKGTRLRPITENIPKPMIKVAGRPILERLVLHLMSYGIRRIFISVNYLAHIIEEYFGDGRHFGCSISYLYENEPLGTGGALSLLPERPHDAVIVLNGDLVTQVNIDALLHFHHQNNFDATMGVRRYAHQVPFGCVVVEAGRILHLDEKPLVEKLINSGVYALSPEALCRIPKTFYPITDLFETSILRGIPVGAYVIEDDWIDVGQHEQLKQARGT